MIERTGRALVLHTVGHADLGLHRAELMADERGAHVLIEERLAALSRAAETADSLEATDHVPAPAYDFHNLPFVTAVEQLRRAGWTGPIGMLLVATAQEPSHPGDTRPTAAAISEMVARHPALLDSGSGELTADVVTLTTFGVEPARQCAADATAAHPDADAVFVTAGSGAKQLSIGLALGALSDPRFVGLLLPSAQDGHVAFSLRLDPLPWLLRTGAFDAACRALPEHAPDEQRDVLRFLAARAQGQPEKELLRALHVRRPDLVSAEAYAHLVRLHGALAFSGLVRARAGEPVGPALLRAWLEAACERDTRAEVPAGKFHEWLSERLRKPVTAARLSWVDDGGADPRSWQTVLKAGGAAAHKNELRGRPVVAATRLLERHAAARPRAHLVDGLLELELAHSVGLPLAVPPPGLLLIHAVGRQEVSEASDDPLPFVTALYEALANELPSTVALIASTTPQPTTGHEATLPLAERAARRWRDLGVETLVIGVDLTSPLVEMAQVVEGRLSDAVADEVTVAVGPGDARMSLAGLLAGARTAGRQAATVSLISLPQRGSGTHAERSARTAISALGHDVVLVSGALELVERLAPIGAQQLLVTGSARLDDVNVLLRRLVARWWDRDAGRAQVELIVRQRKRLGDLAALIAMYAELDGHERLTGEHQMLKQLRNDVLHRDLSLTEAARRRGTTVSSLLTETLGTLEPLSATDRALIEQWEVVRDALETRHADLLASVS